jgi:hypothetical protein
MCVCVVVAHAHAQLTNHAPHSPNRCDDDIEAAVNYIISNPEDLEVDTFPEKAPLAVRNVYECACAHVCVRICRGMGVRMGVCERTVSLLLPTTFAEVVLAVAVHAGRRGGVFFLSPRRPAHAIQNGLLNCSLQSYHAYIHTHTCALFLSLSLNHTHTLCFSLTLSAVACVSAGAAQKPPFKEPAGHHRGHLPAAQGDANTVLLGWRVGHGRRRKPSRRRSRAGCPARGP